MSGFNKSKLTNDLLNIDDKTRKLDERENLDEENIAISRTKEDDKYFFKHAKKKHTIRCTIDPLVNLCNYDREITGSIIQATFDDIPFRASSGVVAKRLYFDLNNKQSQRFVF